MQSYIFVSTDGQTREEEALAFVKKISSSYDTYIYDTTLEAGIEIVREAQTKLNNLPLNSLVNSLIIKDAHNLTLPAQNALLKILEEPPLRSQIILTTSNAELLLPTVISRCQVKNFTSSNLPNERYLKFLEVYDQLALTEKIKLVDSLDIEAWVTSLEKAIVTKISSEDTQGLKELVVLTKRTLKILKLSSFHINKKVMAANILIDQVRS